MKRFIVTSLLAAGCVPNLVSDDVNTDPTEWSWEAPDNRWPTAAPPDGLIGEGFERGDIVPDFRLMDQHGETVSLWQFHGQVVVLDISTMWCSPCRELAEGAEETWEEFEEHGFVYLTVLPEDVEREAPDNDDLNQWGDHYGISQPILSDPERGYSAPAVPGDAFPQVYVIGRDLRVVDRLSVPTDANLRATVGDIVDH